jgi:hypothetical protein
MTVKNPVGQEWDFEIVINVEPCMSMGNIIIESLLHKTGTGTVTIPSLIRSPIAFHAYFAHESAAEFTVMPEHGFIDRAGSDTTLQLPITVVIAPIL